MRLLRVILAFFITAITVMQLSQRKLCYVQPSGAGAAYEASSELEVAMMLLNFGKWFLIIAAIWIILFV